MGSEDWIRLGLKELQALGIDQVKNTGIFPEEGKFFPVIGYPPLTMYPAMDEKPLFEDLQNRPANPMVAYVHLPFCPSRCTFCHWVTKTKSRAEEVDEYLDYLEREMILYKNKLAMDAIPVKSVLIGGGTPTYLSPAQMERFLRAFTTHFDLSACTQFSVEPEPTTILGDEGLEKLLIMKEYGVTRMSMGVQSFDDQILARMGRVHNGKNVFDAIEQMRKAGFENIFIDLIYGYPDQTLDQWIETMNTAVSLDVEGFQLYRLRIKAHGDRPGNILKIYNKKAESFPETEKIYLMKQLGISMSRQHGYHEHQTRIFARKPENISHYLWDWGCGLTDVVGIGVSSWSNLRGVFALNVGDENLQEYYQLISAGKISVNRGMVRSEDDEIRRSFILPLKNSKVNKKTFLQRTGKLAGNIFSKEIKVLKTAGLIGEDTESIFLTQRGRFFADEVSMQFFNPNYLSQRAARAS